MGKAKELAAGAGIEVTGEESTNEFDEKLNAPQKRSKSIDAYLKAMREEEAKQSRPLSGDLEVLRNVSDKDLQILQKKEKRLYAWDPRTRTALVGTLAFMKKKAEKEKKKKKDN